MSDLDRAWMADIELRRHAAQAAGPWQFVCREAGDNEGRRDQLLQNVDPATISRLGCEPFAWSRYAHWRPSLRLHGGL